MFETTNAKLTQPVKISSISLVLLALGYHLCGGTEQWEFGPSPDFVVIGIPIDSWCQYFCLIAAVYLIQFNLLLIEEYAEPVPDFTLYNYQCDYISEFTKWELFAKTNLLYANKDWFKLIRLQLMSHTRLDVMLMVILAEILATLYTTWDLMRNKTFPATAAERNMTAEFIEHPPAIVEAEEGQRACWAPAKETPPGWGAADLCTDPRVSQLLVTIRVGELELQTQCQALPALVQALPRLLLAQQCQASSKPFELNRPLGQT